MGDGSVEIITAILESLQCAKYWAKGSIHAIWFILMNNPVINNIFYPSFIIMEESKAEEMDLLKVTGVNAKGFIYLFLPLLSL